MPSSTGSPLNANSTGTSVTAVIARVAGPLDTARSMFVALQFGYDLAKRLRIAGRIVQLKGKVLSLDIAPRPQSLAETLPGTGRAGNRWIPKKFDKLLPILRACDRRPPHHRRPQKRYEISSVHAEQYGPDRPVALKARMQIV